MATPQEQQILKAYLKYAQKKGTPPSRAGFEAFARKYVQSAYTTASMGPAEHIGGYMLQPTGTMTSEYSSPMAPRVSGGFGASDYFRYIDGLRKEQRAAQREQAKNKRGLKKTLAGEKVKIIKDVDELLSQDFLPKNIEDKVANEDGTIDKKKLKEFRDSEIDRRYQEVKDAYSGLADESAPQAQQAQPKPERYGGGTIEVTGEARPGDAKKGTIAITGGNPDNPKQWIFEPTDDGNYIAKRPVPGSFNKWETGKVVSPGDLYDMTKGEFGTKPQVDETPAVPEPTPSAKPQPQEAWGSGYGPVSGKIQYPENYDVGGYVPEKTLAPTPQEPVREPYTGYEGKGFGDIGRLAQDVYGSASEALNSAKDAWNSDWGGRRGLTPEGFSDAPDYEPELTPEDEELLRQMEEERMMEERMKWAEAQSWQDKRLSPDNYNMDEGGDYGWY